MNKLWRSAAECLVASLALVSLTFISYRFHFKLAAAGFLYVIVVVVVSRFGGFASSVVASILAALCLEQLAPPAFSFRVDDPLDIVAIITFLAVSLTIASLMSRVRKQSEQALRDSEDRLRLAVEAGRMYAFEWDMASDVIVRTGLCGDILNWMDDPTRDTGRQFVANVHPDDRDTYLSPKTRLTPENPAYRIDYRVLHPDGNVIWLEANGRVFFDDQGRRLRIIGLVADVSERKQAESALRETEERFRLVADTAPALIWMSGKDRLCTFFNQSWLEFTGRSIDLELGNGWAEGVHSEDMQRCLDTYVRAFDAREKFTMEYRLRRHDGEYRWVLDRGVPRFNADGSFAGYIGSCMDVTEGRLLEDALSTVSRRLIEAHEEERTWIARELHDDIIQRIALLTVQLKHWAQHPPSPEANVREHIGAVCEQLTDLGRDVQVLSHRLHSSKLEYLGIGVAAGSFCKELSEQQQVEIEFSQAGIPRNLPKEIALCLFRVLQEALQNAVKHSGARLFRVELHGTSSEIRLTVKDLGVGFDPQDAFNHRGIGLISMRERLQLVGGELSIQSEPGHGTTINACVPLSAEAHRAHAAG